jgi:two-component system sensor histidine kinase DesK
MEQNAAGSGLTVQGWARGWRRGVLAAGMLVYPFLTAIGVAQYSRGAAAVIGYAIVVAFCGAHCAAVVATARRARGVALWFLAGTTALFVVSLPFAREYAFYLCAVVVSSAALLLRGRVQPFAAFATLASILVPPLVPSWREGPAWIQAIMIVFTVLLVYAFSEIARANHTLVEARAEVARLATEAERNRIARDLHDLVGHSLTAITVKSNLARQLAESGSPQAIVEIAEVEKLSRQALADVRAAVSGYAEVTLSAELARGRELLRASGVTADLPTAVEVVDDAHQELFGWVVREGVTNVVRHAHARRCTVAVSASAVEIRDDGVGGAAHAGNGLMGLRDRVAAVGGRMETGPLEPAGWQLRVSLE